MKSIVFSFLLLSIATVIFGQDSKKKLYRFDEEKYNELLREENLLFPDSALIPTDTTLIDKQQPNDLKVIPVPEKNMAKMPNMEINKDIHYTIRINKYSLNYPYNPEPYPDSIKSKNGLFLPLNKKQE